MSNTHWIVAKTVVAWPLRYVGGGMVVMGVFDASGFLHMMPYRESFLTHTLGALWLMEWTAFGAALGYWGFHLTGQQPAWSDIRLHPVLRWGTFLGFWGFVAPDVLWGLIEAPPDPGFNGLHGSLPHIGVVMVFSGMIAVAHWAYRKEWRHG